MNRLIRIAKNATPSSGILFRNEAYGRQGVRSFLRDVLALANADVDGPRYIIAGVAFDQTGHRRMTAIDTADFAGKPAYEALVCEHIEPPVRIGYQPVVIDGTRIGVFELGDCQDRPYMMRIDHCETLRRGDAYLRVRDATVKMGRRQLQTLFEKKFRDAVSASSIEVGFPGEILHKERRVSTCDLSTMPSAIAAVKFEELIAARKQVHMTGTNTAVARLTHARLFGSDMPYEERSTEQIRFEKDQLREKYRDDDAHFLFEENRDDLQVVIFNQGDEALRDASLTLALPRHEGFHVAERLPKQPGDGDFKEPPAEEQSYYPTVTLRNRAVQVAANIGEVPPGMPVEVFSRPLRICVGKALAGRRIGIKYTLHARNLRSPAAGVLRLIA